MLLSTRLVKEMREDMKKLLTLTAVGEAVLGLALLVHPQVVVRLLFNVDIAGTGRVMGRVAGIALIALGVTCWPGSGAAQVFWGMLTYSVLATLYLAYLGIEGERAGSLLWSTVVLHAVLTILLVHAWQKEQRT